MSSTIAPPSLTITSVTGSDSTGHNLPPGTTLLSIPSQQIIAQCGASSLSANQTAAATAPLTVKQERHDEAEIAELAAKMVEDQKAALAKQAAQQQQQLVNRQLTANATGQPNILNYLTRKTPQSIASTATAGMNLSNGTSLNGTIQKNSTSPTENGEKKACDEESQKGHFGWATLNKIYIPYVLRSSEMYCAVRMVEMKLLNKYLSYLHPDIYSSCTYVRSYYITEAESRLLNEINVKHCDQQFGRDMFTLKDLVVRLSDATKFYQFLDICYRKLLSGSKSPSDKCGFIRINKESVVPYTMRKGEQVVPLFYFEGETDNLRQKADYLSGWDLAYLKFCCKVQGIRNELFSSESVAVISLTDIKSYFPSGTEFEDYWPSKVVDSNLLIATKNPGNSVNWTRQPTGPPPKIAQPVIQKQQQQQQQQQQIRKNAYQTASGIQNPNVVAAAQRMHSSAAPSIQQNGFSAAAQALTNWGLNSLNLNHNLLTQAQLLAAQTQQQNHRAVYNNRNPTMQNLLSGRQQYNYSNGLQMTPLQYGSTHNTGQQQQPPPLVRSQNQSHLSNSAVLAQQQHLQQQQQHHQQQQQQQAQQQRYNQQMQARNQANAMAAAAAALQLQQRNVAAAAALSSQDPHSQMLRIIPEINPSGGQYHPYKLQKVLVFDNIMVPCINMKAYNEADQLMTLTDFREYFFPNVSLEQCKRLIEALGAEMYKGNRRQIETLIENGKPHSENIPLILVRDVIKYMPQLRYMMRSQEQPPSKRTRIS